jgi:hypothetical protein
MKSKFLRHGFVGVSLAVLLLITSSNAFADQFIVTITVDKNGNGNLTNSSGLNTPLTFTLSPDSGPGGLASALTYNLRNPPNLVVGDLILLDPVTAVVSNIIRFNVTPPERPSFPPGGALVYYSTGQGSLADSGLPLALYANTITFSLVNGGFIYTPTSGQPGFVAGADGPVTYVIHGDTSVPEPASMLLLGSGVFGAIGALRRRRRSKH